MRAIPKAPTWEDSLQRMKDELAGLSSEKQTDMKQKIAALERAIAIRDGLLSPSRVEFTL